VFFENELKGRGFSFKINYTKFESHKLFKTEGISKKAKTLAKK